jgi:glucosyl-3-phosphoglycerate synthase
MSTTRRDAIHRELSLDGWLLRRSFTGSHYDVADLVRRKRQSVTAILPAKNTAATIAGVVAELLPLKGGGLIDDIVVIDADSEDGSGTIAADVGARVVSESAVMPGEGRVLGKGDAMWRALSVTDGEIVVFLDTDTRDFDRGFAVGLLGPLIDDPGIHLVKAAYRRPFAAEGKVVPDEGGRVNELVARPLINLLFPELAGFAQPLAGEVAARRDLLERLPFPVGYGVEIGMLIDSLRLVGQDGMAQVNVGTRQNTHQALRDLVPMAYAVMVTALRRAGAERGLDGFIPGPVALPWGSEVDVRQVPLDERPPLR